MVPWNKRSSQPASQPLRRRFDDYGSLERSLATTNHYGNANRMELPLPAFWVGTGEEVTEVFNGCIA
jgi:hypothetical protein